MVSKKELNIIQHLRNNSRIKLTELSQKLNVPVTTLYSRLKRYEGSLIKKHTCLIDFAKLGYYKNIYLVLKAKEKKEELREFLEKQNCINSLFRTNYDSDFLLNCIFKDEKEAVAFVEKLEASFSLEIRMLNIIEEIKKEEFMFGEEDL